MYIFQSQQTIVMKYMKVLKKESKITNTIFCTLCVKNVRFIMKFVCTIHLLF